MRQGHCVQLYSRCKGIFKYRSSRALRLHQILRNVQMQQNTLMLSTMALPILASISPYAGITAFHLTEMRAQKLWSGGDIQDGKDDPAATRFSLKLVNSEMALDTFRLQVTSRISIVHNDKAIGTQWALTDKQRSDFKHRLFGAAVVGDTEHLQMNNNLDNPVYLLSNVQQQDSSEEMIKDLKNMLRLSASCRQKSMTASQSHWGIHSFIDAYVNEKTIGDIVLKLFSHMMECSVEQGLLHKLKDISTDSKQHIGVPSNNGPMSSSEAFAAVVLGFEFCVRLEEQVTA